ncbi:hypothetical protein G4G27_04275 [Sphingomonas sp. So64.6b]|uniref:hypothetical protein n=1 Tax=Sphingomonas sp. So64.6b TaxID=2997354 RepID=UPI0015FF470E|nr:hypothetical protein [Sphingomonas sp. So64.6b]QNA83309.1 hypothetical protein G4G27_04275 [Sphingomonas sp. So64.6b]
MKAYNLTAGMSADLPICDVTQSDDFAVGQRKPWTTPMVFAASTKQQTEAYTVGFGTDTNTPVYGPFGS